MPKAPSTPPSKASKSKSVKAEPGPSTPTKYTSSTGRVVTPSKSNKWSKEDKIKILMAVVDAGLKGVKVDWEEVSMMFETRTKTQTFDQWRQHILPHLKREGSVVGEK